jgi:AAA family ATP:ADP antiporter
MRTLLKRFVDLREGEGLPTLQAFFALFLLVAGHTIIETARDALFLTKLPADRLTLVYVICAVLAFLTSAANTRFILRFGRRNALIFTAMMAAYGTTIIYFEPKTPLNVFILYVWSAFVGTVIQIQYWMFAAQLFTTVQAKRLFAPITSGGVLGAVAGASSAAILLESISVDALLLIGSALFVSAAVLLTTVLTDEARPPVAAINAAKITPTQAMQDGLLRFFKEQTYLRRIAIVVVLSTAALLSTDYLFKSAASSLGSGRALGTFFARYYAALNGVALVVQVAIASRLLKKRGVLFAVLVMPVLLFSGALGVAIAGGTLALILATKGADGALRYSLHRVATELSWMPVPPEARDRGKAIIDGVLTRGTQAVTASLILGLSMIGWTSPRELAILVLVFVSGWIIAAISLRRPYLDLFRQALRKGTIDLDSTPDELDTNSIETVLEFLSSRDPARVVAAMDLLVEKNRSRLIPGLVLYHEADPVLIRALEIFASDAGRNDGWVSLAERLQGDGRGPVRIAAVQALAKKGLVQLVEKNFEDADPAVRAHAAFCIAQADKENPNPLTDPRIRKLLTCDGEDGRRARIAVLEAVRDLGDARWADFILSMTASPDGEVVEHAALAMARVKDERFIPRLIDRLDLRDGRAAIRSALVGIGETALDQLEHRLFDAGDSGRVRLHIPRTIAHFKSQRAAEILMRSLVSDLPGTIRYKALRGLGRLVHGADDIRIDRNVIEHELSRNLVEHLRMIAIAIPLEEGVGAARAEARSSGALVVGLVHDKAEQALERAFRLLQIAHPREDIRRVYLALASTDRRVRAYAEEFIAVLGSSPHETRASSNEVREILRIVADDLPREERSRRAERFLPKTPTEYAEALSILMRETDEYMAALAAYHALESGEARMRQDVLAVYEARPSLNLDTWLGSAFRRPAEAIGG